MLKEIKLIYTELEKRGKGVDSSPVRRIHQLYTHDGILVAEHDPCGENWFSYEFFNKYIKEQCPIK